MTSNHKSKYIIFAISIDIGGLYSAKFRIIAVTQITEPSLPIPGGKRRERYIAVAN